MIFRTELSQESLEQGHSLVDVCFKSGVLCSKSMARRAILQNGISVNGEKVEDVAHWLTVDDLINKQILIKVGKTKSLKVVVKETPEIQEGTEDV